MRILYLLKKEFTEILRQKELLPLVFIAPLIQIVILGYVVRTDITRIPIQVVNRSQSPVALELCNRIEATPCFQVRKTGRPGGTDSYREVLKRGEVAAVVVFRDKTGRRPFGLPRIQILMDGVDSNTSAIAAGYLSGIIRQYLREEVSRRGMNFPLDFQNLIRFNPDLRSINYMGPGMVGLLLTILTLFLTSVSIVREREQQTMDTLLMSPLRPIEIYLGKALPMAIIGLIQMAVGVVTVILWFRIPVRGNLWYLCLSGLVFLPAILSYALLISTLVRSQQQALFFSWFSMITFILLSGLFTPVANIPSSLRWIADINPIRYLIQIIREIFLKGNGIEYFYRDLLILAGITAGVVTLSLLNFRRFISR